MNTRAFVEKIENREATIGVIGLGYVGLPLVLSYLDKDFRVIGFDVNETKVKNLAAGKSDIKHIPGEPLGRAASEGRFTATGDFTNAKQCDALLMCVPTPLDHHREPDMSFVEATTASIGPHLQPNQLVVLESTTYPGTTDELIRPILEKASGLAAGKDFFLAYSPEREDPGNIDFDTPKIPKVVGGLTPSCQEVAVALYSAALAKVVPVSSTQVAEMSKLLENIFRCVNIALANEMKIVCDRMGIDVWEVVNAAATKPFGFMPFYPGPGLGGHCIPIDPFYLTWKAREFGISTRFIELAGEVNARMPEYVVQRTMEALNQHKKAMTGSKILVLGLAYKRDVDDMRESPALEIIDLLRSKGAVVDYHDPNIPKPMVTRRHNVGTDSVPLTPQRLQSSDAVVIVTDHSDIDYANIVKHAPLVIDTRNATAAFAANRDHVVKA